MREAMVEEQVFWILSHVQGGSADIEYNGRVGVSGGRI